MLTKLLVQHRDTILEKWIDATMSSYKPEMVRFLKKEKNPFSNPVRQTIVTSLEKIYDALLTELEIDDSFPGLDEIVRLRAVQEFTPAQALSFLFTLKNIIRSASDSDPAFTFTLQDWQPFEEKIDALSGAAFNVYSHCRSQIYEIRISEVKARTQRAFELLNRTNYPIHKSTDDEVHK